VPESERGRRSTASGISTVRSTHAISIRRSASIARAWRLSWTGTGSSVESEPPGSQHPSRRQLTKRLYGRTKPGTLLKHHIPLKTDRWDVAVPGFTEIDLVAHCGSFGDGEFVHSLNLTDIYTTWVEPAAVLGWQRFPLSPGVTR
jgi:hypothetical protein